MYIYVYICINIYIQDRARSGREREIFTDNLLVRVHWIIEMIVVRTCAMGVGIPNLQVALFLPSQLSCQLPPYPAN